MRSRPGLRALALPVLATLLIGAAAETALRAAYALRNASVEAIPLPYVPGDHYGPVPPWGDALRLLEPDPDLIWRTRPGARRRYVDVFAPAENEGERRALLTRFLPAAPAALAHLPTWSVTINRRGFRTAEFEIARRPSSLRVVCLGDSWTFGANVDDDATYPRRLAAALGSRFPTVDVEVLNLGVMGYSSLQGLALVRRQALALDPDVLVLGFGMNDSRVGGFHDADLLPAPPPTLARRAAAAVGRLETLRLMRYAAQRLTHDPPSLADLLRAADEGARGAASAARTAPEVYAELEAWTRVPLDAYRRNIAEMVMLARGRGAGVVLLYNGLWEDNPYAGALAETARGEGVPFVNSAALLARERARRDARAERALGLAASAGPVAGEAPDAVEVVLRVRHGARGGARGLYVVGAHPALGGLVPNRIALRDDGTAGDERAGDGVFSLLVRLPAGARLAYVYTSGGREGRWEGLDVPTLREIDLRGARAGERRYRPVETFGRLPLQADHWHTDAAGYRIIADAVLEALLDDDAIHRRLGALAAPGS